MKMKYYISKTVDLAFDEAVEKTIAELGKEGFGVLTDIDVKEVLKKKLDVDFVRYRILGACNPTLAYKTLQAEDRIGLMLPCNVIVRETGDGEVEVSAIDPVSAMAAVGNEALAETGAIVRDKLARVVEGV
jgi:uncharacterized protein (DUF302 family)